MTTPAGVREVITPALRVFNNHIPRGLDGVNRRSRTTSQTSRRGLKRPCIAGLRLAILEWMSNLRASRFIPKGPRAYWSHQRRLGLSAAGFLPGRVSPSYWSEWCLTRERVQLPLTRGDRSRVRRQQSEAP